MSRCAREARANAAAVAARLSDARYRAGVDSLLVSLDVRRTAYEAQLDLAATRLARGNNVVELYRSPGGGLNDTTIAASDPARPERGAMAQIDDVPLIELRRAALEEGSDARIVAPGEPL